MHLANLGVHVKGDTFEGMKTLVIGLDPGTFKFGYAAIVVDDKGSMEFVGAGVFVPNKKLKCWGRILEIGTDLKEWLSQVRLPFKDYGILVAQEEGFCRGGPATKALAGVRGVASYEVARAFGVEVKGYMPLSVKKLATGSGSSDKAVVEKVVRARFGLKTPLDEDAADALAVTLCRAQDA